MKAVERIFKYGLKKYLMSCRKLEMTPELIGESEKKLYSIPYRKEWKTTALEEKYKKKVGATFEEIFLKHMPIDKVVRYKKTLWYIVLERNDERWEGKMGSALHQFPDRDRDENEAFLNAQKRAGGSGWSLVSSKYLGTLKPIYHAQGKYELPKTKEMKPIVRKEDIAPIIETLQAKRDSIALSLKRAGYSAKEVVEALMGVK